MSIFPLEIHEVLYILQLSGYLTNIWPPSVKAGNRELLLRDLVLTIAILNTIITLIPLGLNILYSHNDIVSLMKASSELFILCDAFLNLILCRVARTKLQNLLECVEDFLHRAGEQEKIVLRKYINRYAGFSALMALTVTTGIISFSCGPVFLSTNLPAEGKYPFSIESPVRWFILYSVQVLAIFQIGFGFTADFMVAIFFWYSIVRLDLLQLQLKRVTNEKEMKLCIIRHQEIIEFIEETQTVIRYFMLKTNLTVACTIICGAFPLVYNQPFTVMAQFVTTIVVNCQRLLFTIWPADDLSEISKRVAYSAYKVRWIGESSELSHNLLIMMRRSQKPIEIRISGLFPALSLEYYSNFLRTISSYFMMMRAAIDN